jgi:ribonuclease HI
MLPVLVGVLKGDVSSTELLALRVLYDNIRDVCMHTLYMNLTVALLLYAFMLCFHDLMYQLQTPLYTCAVALYVNLPDMVVIAALNNVAELLTAFTALCYLLTTIYQQSVTCTASVTALHSMSPLLAKYSSCSHNHKQAGKCITCSANARAAAHSEVYWQDGQSNAGRDPPTDQRWCDHRGTGVSTGAYKLA